MACGRPAARGSVVCICVHVCVSGGLFWKLDQNRGFGSSYAQVPAPAETGHLGNSDCPQRTHIHIIYSLLIGISPEQLARGAGCGHCCCSRLHEYKVCLWICAAGHVYNIFNIHCMCVCLLARCCRNTAWPHRCLDPGTCSSGSLILTGMLDSASP